MELQPDCKEKVARLIDKGVRIPNPLTLDIGQEVSVDRISGESVVIYPGCRIYGEKTVVSAGARIGYEGPVTIDNCRIGPKVESKAATSTIPFSSRARTWAWERRSGKPAFWKKRRAARTAWGLSRPYSSLS